VDARVKPGHDGNLGSGFFKLAVGNGAQNHLESFDSRTSWVLVMRTLDVKEAKANLAILIEEAAKGDGFIITMAGKPLVKIVALNFEKPPAAKRRGFMAGQITIPSDFDRMANAEIEQMFSPSNPKP
jgi:prevent-host-death family protein